MTKLAWYQLLGFLVVSGAIFTAIFLINEPTVTTSLGTILVSLISWYVGKLVGTPTTEVLAKSIENAPPERLEQILRSLPPDSNTKIQVALTNVSSVPPAIDETDER